MHTHIVKKHFTPRFMVLETKLIHHCLTGGCHNLCHICYERNSSSPLLHFAAYSGSLGFLCMSVFLWMSPTMPNSLHCNPSWKMVLAALWEMMACDPSQQITKNTRRLPCTYGASPPCVASYGPPACTVP